MSKPKPFMRLIDNAMAKRGLSQRKAAKIVGCQQPTLNRWLKGITTPGIANLRGLALLTGVGIDALVEIYEKAQP